MEKLTNIGKFLDSTYLKTANESSISELKNKEIVISFIEEAIKNKYACIMIRPKYVQLACEKIQFCNSELKVGTVIDFPLGSSDTHIKIKEAEDAIENGAYELDFVCDYNAFKRKNLKKFDSDILNIKIPCKAVDNNYLVEFEVLNILSLREVMQDLNPQKLGFEILNIKLLK